MAKSKQAEMKNDGFTTYTTASETLVFEQGKPITGKLNILKNPFNPDGTKKGKAIHVLSIDGKPCPEHFALQSLVKDIENKKIKPYTEGLITYVEAILDKKGKVKFVKYKVELKQ